MQGKRVIVTGAAQGIGRAIAVEMASRGAEHVVVADQNAELGKQTVELIAQVGGKATFVAVDLRDSANIASLVEESAAVAGGVDTVVNNAGVIESALTEHTTVDALPEDIWDLVMGVNLKAAWLLTKHAVPHLRASGRGPSIVNAASVSGLTGYPAGPAYCSSKGGVVQLTRASAVDLSPDIRVNAFAPGSVQTQMSQSRIEAAPDKAAVEKFMSGSHLVRRIGQPEEVAKLACFLASDDASFITGAVYTVDGGSLAWRGTN